jgi:hypothetical protein
MALSDLWKGKKQEQGQEQNKVVAGNLLRRKTKSLPHMDNNSNHYDMENLSGSNNNNNRNGEHVYYNPLQKVPNVADKSTNRSAVALGLGAFVATTAHHFAQFPAIAQSSVASGFSASALNTAIAVGFSVVATPFAAACVAGFFNRQLQLQKYMADHGIKNYKQIPESVKRDIWNNSTRPVMYKMGAAFFGAELFTTIFEQTGFGEMIANTMCTLEGSMPWQLDVVMMIASGVGLALFLTAATIYQNKQAGKPTNTSEIVTTLFTGLLAGMGAYAASMIPGLNQVHHLKMPGWAANVVSGVACGVVITALFSLLPKMTEASAKVGHSVERKWTQYQNMQAARKEYSQSISDNSSNDNDRASLLQSRKSTSLLNLST